jgi:hypothetical protein
LNYLDYFSGGMEADTNANFMLATGAASSTDKINPVTQLYVTDSIVPPSGGDFFGEIGTMFKQAGAGAIEAVKLPIQAAGAVAEKAKSLLLYLIMGVVIVGVVLVFAHGAGSKFAGRIAL